MTTFKTKFNVGDVIYHIEWDGDRFEEDKPYAVGPYTIGKISVEKSGVKEWGVQIHYTGFRKWVDGLGEEHSYCQDYMIEKDCFASKSRAKAAARRRWNARLDARKMR